MHRLFAIFAALLFAACGKPSKQGALRVGMELTYPPFEMKDPEGNPDGVGVRLAEALAADLGKPLEIVPMEFTGLIPALKSGSVDVVISSMSATDVRRRSIDFSEPYAFIGLAVLVGRDSPIHSADDLRKPGTRIAVKAGTTGESWVSTNLPDAVATAFGEDAACVLEVVQGRADAFIYDQLSIYRHHRKNERSTRALLDPFVEEQWAVGMRKGSDDLKERVDAFIRKFRAGGGFEDLGNRYLAEEKKALEEMGMPFVLR